MGSDLQNLNNYQDHAPNINNSSFASLTPQFLQFAFTTYLYYTYLYYT